jgi:UDP-GlcNAc:undecaprenyl-phosphate GlcNAc-1-phosphate transferase
VWVYILNITNFTDGSDGFLGTNTVFLCLNLILINNFLNLNLFSSKLALLILPSIIAFLYFNRPNAKLYMGDSGSILIGFINGYIFLELFSNGFLNLAISLLIYPLLDCSLALIKKTFKGIMPWADISNYSFLQPTIKKNKNKFFVFYINIIFNIFNSILIFGQLYFGWLVIFLNILLSLLFIKIYEKKT